MAERPVFIRVLDERYDHVARGDAAAFFQFPDQQAIERLFGRAPAGPARNLQKDDVLGARDVEAGVFYDQARGLMLSHDLITVPLGDLERSEHGAVGGIEEGFELGVGAAFDKIETEKRHG